MSRKQGATIGAFVVALGVILWTLVGGMRATDPARTERLLELLEDDNPEMRLAAAASLAAVDTPQVVQGLGVALGDPDRRVGASAAWALWRLGRRDMATQAFERSLVGEDQTARLAAVTALRRLEDRATATLLVRALGDRSPGVRTEAALGLIRINHQAGFDSLERSLSDLRPNHRVAAARALSHVDDPRAVTIARRQSQGDDVAAAALAEAVLLHWGEADGALPALTRALQSAPDAVRASVCDALGHLSSGGPPPAPLLAALAAGTLGASADVACKRAVGRMGSGARRD
jgi:HEAT repeat protein